MRALFVPGLLASVTLVVLLGGSRESVAQQSERFTLGPDVSTRVPPPDIEEQARRLIEAWKTYRSPDPPDGQDENASKGRGSVQNETAIAINPLDPLNVVAVSNDYSSGNVLTGFYSTLDGGVNWTTGDLPLEPGFSFSGDPSVIFTPDGIPVIVCLQYFGPAGSGIYGYRSLDGGLTWQTGVQIDLNGANDKVQTGCDFSGGPFHGQICSAWDRFGTGSGDHIYLSRSDNGGMTWKTSKRVNDANNRATISPDVAYGANSELWVMWADRGTEEIYVDRSIDGGVTFGADILASGFNIVPSPIPGSSFRMFDIFSITADWTDGPYSGTVYVAYHTWKGGVDQNANIRCASSSDHGATWTNFIVNDDGFDNHADQVMPHAAVDSKGNLNVGFFDRRLDPNNLLLWTWVARSSDGGQTFSNHQVSGVGWDHNATEFPSFIGDYTGLDVWEHFVRPCWTDGRSGSQNVMSDDVYLDFFSDESVLSAATGGQVHFTINIGPNYAGQDYWMFGSLGTSPGLTFGNGVHLPLNFDAFFLMTIQLANTAVLQNSMGVLDATGSALPLLDTFGPFDPAFSGFDLFFATLVGISPPTFATNSTTVTLTL